MRSRLLPALLALAVVLWPTSGAAFCGFYVSGSGGPLVNDATQVVLMRSGLRTVLSMANDYQGPPEAFALVIPVPVVLREENVRTLPRSVFQQIDRLDSPRLVEYWEQDPCPPERDVSDDKEGGTGTRMKGEEGSMGAPRRAPLVKVEAEFSVDEYEIVILSALDAVALDTWLREHKYQIPEGADRYLRPYVQGGSKFFVAKVDPRKLSFRWGRATLSPLRFFYDTESFSLPVRLGLMNADGPQDLIVHILAEQRYETANYENLFIPTNLEVVDGARDRFPSFYASLFDRTIKGHPRAVVTEYAWSAGSCDPCPTPPLVADGLAAFGADVLPPAAQQVPLTLTRLHARYTRDTLGDDLVFKPAASITGGREIGLGKNPKGAEPTGGSSSAFQARYIIRHRWEGPVTCANPQFGVWGGPEGGAQPPRTAAREATVRRDLPLETLLAEDSPTLGVRAQAPRNTGGGLELRRLLERALTSYALVGAALAGALVLVGWIARRARRPVIRALLALLGLAALPLVLLLSTPHVRMIVAESGGFAVAVAATFILCLAVILALRLRGGGDRAALVLALLPAAVAILRTGAAFARTIAASREPNVDFELSLRILSEGESESLATLMIGLWTSSLLCLVAGWPRPARDGERAPRGRLAILGITAVALAACIGVRVALAPHRIDTDVPLFLVIALAGLAARRLPQAEPDDAWRAVIALGAAAFLASTAALVGVHRLGLGAIAGESVDPAQKLNILARMVHDERLRALALPLDVAAATATAIWIVRHTGHSITPTLKARLAPALAALVLLVAAGLWQRSSFDAPFAAAGTTFDRFAPGSGVALSLVPPEDLPAAGALHHKLGGPAVYVSAQGALLASPASASPPRPYEPATWNALAKPSTDDDTAAAPLLAADGGLRLEALLRALAPLSARRQTQFHLLLTPRALDPRALGVYRGLAGSGGLSAVDVEIAPSLLIVPAPARKDAPGTKGTRSLGVLVDGERARAVVLQGKRGVYAIPPGAEPFDLPLGSAERSARSRLVASVREIVLACPPSMEVGAIARRMIALATPDLESFVITPDTAALSPALR